MKIIKILILNVQQTTFIDISSIYILQVIFADVSAPDKKEQQINRNLTLSLVFNCLVFSCIFTPGESNSRFVTFWIELITNFFNIY